MLAAWLAASAPAAPVEVVTVALVEARPARWRPVPPDAPVVRTGWTRAFRPCLGATREFPCESSAADAALAAALAPLARPDRRRMSAVLDALGEWAAGALVLDSLPPGCPSAWSGGGEVLRDRHGNDFERARALVTVLRAAGVPARPAFNGVPLVLVAVPAAGREPAFWTAWDPLHPAASIRALPVLWMPLRGGDVPPVRFSPAPAAGCGMRLDGRRYPDRLGAQAAFDLLRESGRWPETAVTPLDAGAAAWWEVWATGIRLEAQAVATRLTVPLPYLREAGYGTRAHAVWCSDPARLGVISPPLTETDQDVGGLLMTLRIALKPGA